MFLQGNLQVVFDALYAMGAIDPVLKMDWLPLHDKMKANPERLKKALMAINGCFDDQSSLIEVMKGMDAETVNFLAMEVARELAEFTERQTLH